MVRHDHDWKQVNLNLNVEWWLVFNQQVNLHFFVPVRVSTFCVSISPCLQCCRRCKVDTKETTRSSIVVARSKGGYQKNRLEMPVRLLYSHRSNQLVFTKSWYIWCNHLQPPMERLDSKSSIHTKQPFLAMLQKMESGHKGNNHFIHFSCTFERRIPKEPSWNAGLISLFTVV